MVDKHIGSMIKNRSRTDEESLLRMISDLVVGDMSNVRQFFENETYFKKDVVYMYDEIQGLHKVYKCKRESICGPFNPSDWDDVGLVSGGASNKEFIIDTGKWISIKDDVLGDIFRLDLRHEIGSINIVTKVYDNLGREIFVDVNIVDENNVSITSVDAFEAKVVIVG